MRGDCGKWCSRLVLAACASVVVLPAACSSGGNAACSSNCSDTDAHPSII